MALNRRASLGVGAAAFAALLAPVASRSADFKSPQAVKKGLRILDQVVRHTGRLIAARNYDLVPGEHHETVEGADFLRQALKAEAADLKTKVEAELVKTVAASAAMETPSKAKDDAALVAAHARFAASVQNVIALFPADLHPPVREKKS